MPTPPTHPAHSPPPNSQPHQPAGSAGRSQAWRISRQVLGLSPAHAECEAAYTERCGTILQGALASPKRGRSPMKRMGSALLAPIRSLGRISIRRSSSPSKLATAASTAEGAPEGSAASAPGTLRASTGSQVGFLRAASWPQYGGLPALLSAGSSILSCFLQLVLPQAM